METKPLQMWMGIIKNWSRLNASFPVCYVVRSCTIAHNHSTIQCPHVHCDRTLHPHTCITFCIGASFYFWLCRCVYIWPGSFWIKFQYLPYRVWCVLNTEFYCTHGDANASESKHSIILQYNWTRALTALSTLIHIVIILFSVCTILHLLCITYTWCSSIECSGSAIQW